MHISAQRAVDARIEQISVLGRFGIGFPVINTGGRDANLANFVSVTVDLRDNIDDPHIRIGERNTDGTDTLFPVWRVDGHKARRLCKAVTFADGHACGLFKPAVQFKRQRRRATKCQPQGRDISVTHRALHQRGHGRWHGDHERGFVTLNQLPEVVEHTVTAIALRRREHDLRTRTKRRTQRHNRGKHVEHRQRTHLHVMFGEQQTITQPRVIDDPGIAVLRDLGHTCRTTGVEIGGDAVNLTIRKGQCLGLTIHFHVKVHHLRGVGHRVLGPDQRHDQLFDTSQIT